MKSWNLKSVIDGHWIEQFVTLNKMPTLKEEKGRWWVGSDELPRCPFRRERHTCCSWRSSAGRDPRLFIPVGMSAKTFFLSNIMFPSWGRGTSDMQFICGLKPEFPAPCLYCAGELSLCWNFMRCPLRCFCKFFLQFYLLLLSACVPRLCATESLRHQRRTFLD